MGHPRATFALLATVLTVVTLATFAATPAVASVITTVAVTCPVCRSPVQALVVVTTDSRGGVDRDLFARSAGDQHVFFRISTCTTCYYSGYFSDFDAALALPRDFVQKVRVTPKLAPAHAIARDAPQREIDPDDRYALAIRCYEWRGRSLEALAWLHLRRAWLVRENNSVVPRDRRLARVFAFARRWTQPAGDESNQADRELRLVTELAARLAEGAFNRYQRPFVEMAMAVLLRRHGEHDHAEPLLRKLRKNPLLTEPLRRAADRLHASLDRERAFQARAAAYFIQAWKTKQIPAANAPVAAYLIAELHRRLGEDAEALRWYDLALAETALPPDLRRWAVRQRDVAARAQVPAGDTP